MVNKEKTWARRQMANNEKIWARPPYGHIGSLLYLPYEGDDGGIGTFETSRRLHNPPELRVVRPFDVVKSAPKVPDVAGVSGVTYSEKRVQRRWLKNTLPEAYLGNTVFWDFLSDDRNQMNPRDATESKVPAAAGEISDCRDPWRVTGAASLAMAAGESGQILRLLHLDESPWFWEGYEDVSLGAWDLKPGDREEEAYWCQSAAAITRIKYFTHLAFRAPLRWLIVQKELSTTILSPVYHSVPVAYSNAALEGRSASRIDPNELLSFTLEHTEGRPHVDVDINPPHRDLPLQVALIDDHGGWSIWNVTGDLHSTSGTLRTTLYMRGTFWEDLSDEQKGDFGILWYHPPPDLDGQEISDDKDPENVNTVFGATPVLPRRSHTVLMWSCTTIQVLNVEAGSIFSYLAITQRSLNKDKILQVLSNPLNPSQALVLTTHSMLCLDICPEGEDAQVEPHIVHAYFHDHPGDPTLQLSVSSCLGDRNAAFVLIYPRDGPQVSIFWFYAGVNGSLGQFSHQLQYFRRGDSLEPDAPHTLSILPMRLASYKKSAAHGPGSTYRDLNIEFHQVVSVGRRQGMGYWTCATVDRGADKILAPEPWTTAWGPEERNPAVVRQIKRRVAYVNYMAEKFVVPDALENVDSMVARHGEGETGDESPWLEFEPPPSVKRQILAKRRFYPHVALEAYRAQLTRGTVLRSESLEAVRQMLHVGLRLEGVPRRSLLECAGADDNRQAIPNGLDGAPTPFDDEEWAQQFAEVVEDGIGTLSLKSVHTNPPWRTDDFAEKLAEVKRSLSDHWPVPPDDAYPEAAAQRRTVLSETAFQAVLAYHTIEVKEPFSTSQSSSLRPLPSTLPSSSQSTSGLGSQPLSSQLSSFSQLSIQPRSQSSSQKEARRATEKETSRAAVARLAKLATNLNQHAPLSNLTQHPVISRWDDAAREEYVPLVQKPAEAQEERLRRKYQKSAARRRAKEETYNRLLGRGEPASSPPRSVGGVASGGEGLSQGASIPIRAKDQGGQLMSSQSQITMSQPVGGVFGQRPRKKKKKGGIK